MSRSTFIVFLSCSSACLLTLDPKEPPSREREFDAISDITQGTYEAGEPSDSSTDANALDVSPTDGNTAELDHAGGGDRELSDVIEAGPRDCASTRDNDQNGLPDYLEENCLVTLELCSGPLGSLPSGTCIGTAVGDQTDPASIVEAHYASVCPSATIATGRKLRLMRSPFPGAIALRNCLTTRPVATYSSHCPPSIPGRGTVTEGPVLGYLAPAATDPALVQVYRVTSTRNFGKGLVLFNTYFPATQDQSLAMLCAKPFDGYLPSASNLIGASAR